MLRAQSVCIWKQELISPPQTAHLASLFEFRSGPNYAAANLCSCLCYTSICVALSTCTVYLISTSVSTSSYLCICILESAFQHRNCSRQLNFSSPTQNNNNNQTSADVGSFGHKCRGIYIWLGKYLQRISMFAASVNSSEKMVRIAHFTENDTYHLRHLRKFKATQTLSRCNRL